MRTTRRPPKDPLDHDPDAVFGARKAALNGAGMTQQQVADLCGVSRSFIAEIELGTRNAPAEMIGKLAAALGCPREDLERKREPKAQTAPSTDVDVPEREVRSGQRANTDQVLEVRN